ncbi:MAG: deoxyribodipyrimidine photo-lyase [Planctomycetes bacterium]|nr:deoxyribodipyrimidine photo-lyase [Planctomycetota bacterium]
MQASQRAEYNHALEYGILCANKLGLPLVVCFGLTPNYPDANLRHYVFMLQGLSETAEDLKKRGIPFSLLLASPDHTALDFAAGAALIVTDRGYTTIQCEWRERVARKAPCPMVQVETDVIVPVETASDKEEYGARTIRPKITRALGRFAVPLKKQKLANISKPPVAGEDISRIDTLLKKLKLNCNVLPAPIFTGGRNEAMKRLQAFLASGLDRYDKSNDPNAGAVSTLSPYLHFGQISPLEIFLTVRGHEGESADEFIEQIVVRRELAINFVYYNHNYDSYSCLPEWARKSLAKHGSNAREYIYSYKDFAEGATHDPAWNAAQIEMVKTGYMHGYMRMYWGKKIIEWSRTPQEAFETMLKLNNTYELDGRDPNGFCGVAWCFGKHDRPWKERVIFGTIRYMNYNGLKRKFDIAAYIDRCNKL